MHNLMYIVQYKYSKMEDDQNGRQKSISDAAKFISFVLSVREWYKHKDLLNMIIPALWERISRTVSKGRTYTPKNVVHIDANLSPEDLKLNGANESKITFIYSGSKPLNHPNKMQITNEMEYEAKQLHRYLPIVLALGIKSTLTQVNDLQLLEYEGLLKVEADEREGRKIMHFGTFVKF